MTNYNELKTKNIKKNINTLFNNSKFEEIIIEYANLDFVDGEVSYLIIASFLFLEKYGEAYEYFKFNRMSLENESLSNAITLLALILVNLNDKYSDEDEFSRYSQEKYKSFFETFKNGHSLQEFINNLKDDMLKKYTDDIYSDNYKDVFNYLNNLNGFVDKTNETQLIFYCNLIFDAFSQRQEFDSIKALLFTELISLGFDKEVCITKNGKIYYVNFSELQADYKEMYSTIQEAESIVKSIPIEKKLLTEIIDEDISSKMYANLPSFYSKEEMKSLILKAFVRKCKSKNIEYKNFVIFKRLNDK